jgi:hypothetical protein
MRGSVRDNELVGAWWTYQDCKKNLVMQKMPILITSSLRSLGKKIQDTTRSSWSLYDVKGGFIINFLLKCEKRETYLSFIYRYISNHFQFQLHVYFFSIV